MGVVNFDAPVDAPATRGGERAGGRGLMIQLAQANAVRLPLGDGVVSLCVTSPPYWGLRAYTGEQVLTWGGDAGCSHAWRDEQISSGKGGQVDFTSSGLLRDGRPEKGRIKTLTENAKAPQKEAPRSAGQFCQRCHAWRGALGLEPTLDLFIEHLVEVFREVRRVLAPHGLCFVNLGDSYASKPTGSDPARYCGNSKLAEGERRPSKISLGIPAKNLCLIPQRAAIALQADGWWVRSFMPWIKNNCLPESVRDRPTTSHEYWIMLAKSKRYFWDQESVRVGAKSGTDMGILRSRVVPDSEHVSWHAQSIKDRQDAGINSKTANQSGTRNRRTSDTWLDGLGTMITEQRRYLAHLEEIRDGTGMLAGQDSEPLGVRFNTANFKGAHFATYPAKMITPFIKAGSSERGCCPVCRAAWRRVVEHSKGDSEAGERPKKTKGMASKGSTLSLSGNGSVEWAKRGGKTATTGWRHTCACQIDGAIPLPIPALVLDPFVGSGTTLEVARALGRDAIGFDLSLPYLRDQARERLSLTALDAWENGVDGGDNGQLAGLPMFDGVDTVPQEPAPAAAKGEA